MVPRGVRGPERKAQASGLETPAVDQGGEQDVVRGKDADDVERYAQEHRGDESPASEAKGEKRGPEGELADAPAEKYLRVPPLPLGLDEDEAGQRRPTTPEVKLPITPRREEQVLDDSEVREPRSKAARSQPDSSPSVGLCPPQYAGSISRIYVNDVYRVNDEAWEEEEVESYMETEDVLKRQQVRRRSNAC